ncbi:hypothetical protein OZ410_07985 [Robiginitalea sp. M366]|uniref:hypothetical protein n=1 Tax=Robiginitalea aestuariiviva TaxID=3036903 RepID=UPI00240D35D3|nr:hypothetical protein [Robiginitalea aestuariiviva]MDG1572251.1 hypothetical protein [Robiginitalea aestuariiviva]
MKKLVIALVALSLWSCSKDEGPAPNPNADLVLGTWNLTELRISPPQDVNEDGNTTTNVLDELDCIAAQITLRSDNTWTFNGNDLVVTTITGGLFKFFCSEDNRNSGGNWDIQGNTVRLADGAGVVTTFTFDSSAATLTNLIGEVLPGLQAEVYTQL